MISSESLSKHDFAQGGRSGTMSFPSPVSRLTLCLPALKLKGFSAYLSK